MDDIIKCRDLVVSDIKVCEEKNNIEVTKRVLTLKKIAHGNTTRLGHVLKSLPHGLVYKEETGMGATQLELETPRNSIIVEPIKIT